MSNYRLATVAALVIAAAQALLPPPDVSGSEWAGQYRVLSSEDSGSPGHWDLSARPYQNEIGRSRFQRQG
jgi:phage terminase large subunit GpA-like protein